MAKILDWIFNAAKGVYRYVTRSGGGSIGVSELLEARDGYTDIKVDAIGNMANQLMGGDISLQQWTLNFREELKTTYINQYLAGRGGLEAMTQADWGSIGGMLQNQYRYMNNFAADIAAGRLSPAQVEARMRLYTNSATQSFERGKSRAMGVPTMPQYPGDGSTRCRSNCKCNWNIVETDTEWQCTWQLNPAEHCPDCITNSQRWNPLVIPK